ncbi:MAG: hypothetical protein QNM02_06330 [Acidimicrobiia bacterium]|nr:hypothetical protein [Acidimicrobiia bacterium]
MDVQQQRSYDVDWRFISLWMVNDDNHADWYTPRYRAGHYFGHQGLRIADAIRLGESDPDAVGRWYTAAGTAFHVDKRRDAEADADDLYRTLLVENGFDEAYVVAADDESHDEYLRAETELALSRTGDDVGTPILTFHPGRDTEGSFFGPVVSKAPRGAEAIVLWEAVETLATTSGMAELKRSNRVAPDFT